MSAVYYAYAVIGVRLLPEQFVTKDVRPVRGCEHKFDSDFCPLCGSPKWKERKISFDALVTDEGDDELDVFHGIPVSYDTDDRHVYLGITAKITDEGCGPDIATQSGRGPEFVGLSRTTTKISVEQIREKLKSVLEPLGIWDEKSFGLWAVLYCSY